MLWWVGRQRNGDVSMWQATGPGSHTFATGHLWCDPASHIHVSHSRLLCTKHEKVHHKPLMTKNIVLYNPLSKAFQFIKNVSHIHGAKGDSESQRPIIVPIFFSITITNLNSSKITYTYNIQQ